MIYSKETHEVFHLSNNSDLGTFGISNDLDGGAPYWPSRYIDGKLYRMEYANRLKRVLNNELIDQADFKNQKLRDKLMAFRENLSDEDGRILVVVTLK